MIFPQDMCAASARVRCGLGALFAFIIMVMSFSSNAISVGMSSRPLRRGRVLSYVYACACLCCSLFLDSVLGVSAGGDGRGVSGVVWYRSHACDHSVWIHLLWLASRNGHANPFNACGGEHAHLTIRI